MARLVCVAPQYAWPLVLFAPLARQCTWSVANSPLLQKPCHQWCACFWQGWKCSHFSSNLFQIVFNLHKEPLTSPDITIDFRVVWDTRDSVRIFQIGVSSSFSICSATTSCLLFSSMTRRYSPLNYQCLMCLEAVQFILLQAQCSTDNL